MNRFSLTLLIVCTLIFSSCSSDDDSNSENNDFNIAGIWEGTAVDFDTVSTVEINGEGGAIVCEGNGFDIDFEIIFSEDPNEYVANGDFSVLSDCTPGGEQINEDVEVFGNGTWEYTNGTLIMAENGESFEVTIVELNENSIVLEVEEELSFEDGGIYTTTDIEIAISLQRQ